MKPNKKTTYMDLVYYLYETIRVEMDWSQQVTYQQQLNGMVNQPNTIALPILLVVKLVDYPEYDVESFYNDVRECSLDLYTLRKWCELTSSKNTPIELHNICRVKQGIAIFLLCGLAGTVTNFLIKHLL